MPSTDDDDTNSPDDWPWQAPKAGAVVEGEASQMDKWEYKTYDTPGITEQTLNLFGADGWKLIAVMPGVTSVRRPGNPDTSVSTRIILIFKRRTPHA